MADSELRTAPSRPAVRTAVRMTCASAGDWTGRSALSFEVERVVPAFVATGTRRTRVSEMRTSARRIAPASLRGAAAGPVPHASARGTPRTAGRESG